MSRLQRCRWVPALVLLGAGCSTGPTTVGPTANAPSATASPNPASSGFPTTPDDPVLAAARAFVERVTSYDHTRLGDQLNGVLPLTGQPLTGQLQQSLSPNGDFAKAEASTSRDAKGTVLDLGLVSRAGSRAVVLVFVDQQITSPGGNGVQRLRERVTLTQANGAWVATKLETL